MKKLKLIIIFSVGLVFTKAQIGINTTTPKANLDVGLQPNYQTGDLAGIAFPILTGDQAEAMVTNGLKAGTLVYISTPSSNTNPDINQVGYWYWSGDSIKKWEPLDIPYKTANYFYAPSLVLPTFPTNISTDPTADIYFDGTFYHVNLFEIYRKQYSFEGAATTPITAFKNPSAGSLPVLTNSELDYFITYFDNNAFDASSISVSDLGILKYKIKADAILSDKTYMNIVFKVK